MVFSSMRNGALEIPCTCINWRDGTLLVNGPVLGHSMGEEGC